MTNHIRDLLSAIVGSVTSSFRTPDVLSLGGCERLGTRLAGAYERAEIPFLFHRISAVKADIR